MSAAQENPCSHASWGQTWNKAEPIVGSWRGATSMDSGVLWAEQHIRLKRCREGAFIYNINDAFIGRALDKYGEISRGEIMFLCQLIRPGMTVVEVGANIGLLTVPFARLVA